MAVTSLLNKASITDVLALKNNQNLQTYDVSSISAQVAVNTANLNTAMSDIANGIAVQITHTNELANHETRITTLESNGGYTGSITVVTSVNFTTSTTTTQTLTYTNGRLTGVA